MGGFQFFIIVNKAVRNIIHSSHTNFLCDFSMNFYDYFTRRNFRIKIPGSKNMYFKKGSKTSTSNHAYSPSSLT